MAGLGKGLGSLIPNKKTTGLVSDANGDEVASNEKIYQIERYSF